MKIVGFLLFGLLALSLALHRIRQHYKAGRNRPPGLSDAEYYYLTRIFPAQLSNGQPLRFPGYRIDFLGSGFMEHRYQLVELSGERLVIGVRVLEEIGGGREIKIISNHREKGYYKHLELNKI